MIINKLLKKISAKFFRIESEIFRFFYRMTGLRPGSYPYVSGDTYRQLAEIRWDENKPSTIDSAKIKDGNIVFLSSWNIPAFLAGEQEKIKSPFILISSNGDINITKALGAQLSSKCIRWYAQNVIDLEDSRIIPIPIGLENKDKHWHGHISDFRRLQKKKNVKKRMRILYGFAVVNNPVERNAALESLRHQCLAEPVPKANTREYREILQNYAFVASPPGNGDDCHRTWEALYLETIPIVKKSAGTDFFVSLGIPLLQIESWDEIIYWTEEYLLEVYQRLSHGFKSKALWFPYWSNRISQGV